MVGESMTKIDLKSVIQQVEPSTKAAQLRDVMPDIEEKLAAGVTLAQLHEAMTKAGFQIAFETVKTYLYQYRRKHGKPARQASRASAATRPASAPSPAQDPDSAGAGIDNSRSVEPSTPQLASPAPSTATGATGPSPTARSKTSTEEAPVASSSDAEDGEIPLQGSGRLLSVHKALIAARKSVAATDYSKFVRKRPTRKAKS